jgi:hypothetical protein
MKSVLQQHTTAAAWAFWRWRIDKGGATQRFSGDRRTRLLFLSVQTSIALEQMFPLFLYRAEMRDRWNIEMREQPTAAFEKEPGGVAGPVDYIFLQTTWDKTAEQLRELMGKIRKAYPGAKVVYLDWFAPLSLPYAAILEDEVEGYVKKNIFRNRSQYRLPVIGDTNLSDFYLPRKGVFEPMVYFPVSDSFLKKLVVGWNFALTPHLYPYFLGKPPVQGDRPIDLHARFAVKGSPWYQQMRSESRDAVQKLRGLNIASVGKLTYRKFIAEMRRSKVCFSPFGYGEVCWRDFEAAMCGSVLLKHDSSHVFSEPDLYRPEQTYVPLAWDLHDLPEKCERLLADPARRAELAANAFDVVSDYVKRDRFLDLLQKIFDVANGAKTASVGAT